MRLYVVFVKDSKVILAEEFISDVDPDVPEADYLDVPIWSCKKSMTQSQYNTG